MHNIIIDCDPGCDDTIALIAALKSPKINVLGITSIGGNVDPVITQKNALGICALVGRTDVPVFSGATRPLQKEPVHAGHVHGETGIMGLVLPFDQAAQARTDMNAVEFILRETHRQKDVTLIVIGPMTNIANAYLADPTLPLRVKEIVTMGGAYGSPGGNITATAEFNIFCDPQAAKIVYDNFPSIRAFPLDVTYKTMQGADFREWLSAHGVKGQNLASMLRDYAATYPRNVEPENCPLHDFHTVAVLLDPQIYRMERGNVAVSVTPVNEGQTLFQPSGKGPVEVALGVDRERFFTVLKSAMAFYLK